MRYGLLGPPGGSAAEVLLAPVAAAVGGGGGDASPSSPGRCPSAFSLAASRARMRLRSSERTSSSWPSRSCTCRLPGSSSSRDSSCCRRSIEFCSCTTPTPTPTQRQSHPASGLSRLPHHPGRSLFLPGAACSPTYLPHEPLVLLVLLQLRVQRRLLLAAHAATASVPRPPPRARSALLVLLLVGPPAAIEPQQL